MFTFLFKDVEEIRSYLHKLLSRVPLNLRKPHRLLKIKRNRRIIGVSLIIAALAFLGLTFYPLIGSESRYFLEKNKEKVVVFSGSAPQEKSPGIDYLIPVDEDFGIVIPKIEANAKVIPNVDAENPAIYQRALTQGVAQAAGSANPDEEGNMFIFAHSGQDILEANRYNAVFYLLSKLERGDEIDIFYQKQKYHYLVTDKKIVAPEEVQFMDDIPGKSTLTLMTCWPGGTTWKRLVVQTEQTGQ